MVRYILFENLLLADLPILIGFKQIDTRLGPPRNFFESPDRPPVLLIASMSYEKRAALGFLG